MTAPTPLPHALYQAQLDLALRTSDLTRDSLHHWLAFGQQLQAERLEALQDAVASASRAGEADAHPAEAFWGVWRQRAEQARTATQTAVGIQAAWWTGWRDALQAWQHDTTQALGQAATAFVPPAPPEAGKPARPAPKA